MANEVFVREIAPIDVKNGYLIDGFPYTGLANAIATESLINNTSQFELAGVIDSDLFPPISIVREEVPNFPARILVNKDLKVAVFSSYLTPHESIHRQVAQTMLEWAEDHKVSYIISSSAIKTDEESPFVIGVGSTDEAKKKLRDSGIPVLKNGTIPGIPGILLNEGLISNINVIVLLCKARDSGPDFRAGAEICMAMSKLVPGASCDLKSLLNEAEGIEENLKQTEKDAGPLRDAIYG
ncbi:MAG: proteasome assembly chaperone family protein [Thaumarchaeota archaeon]|nr:proteasome assembly chaperone family protein [Nitrososphaerota archaeon]